MPSTTTRRKTSTSSSGPAKKANPRPARKASKSKAEPHAKVAKKAAGKKAPAKHARPASAPSTSVAAPEQRRAAIAELLGTGEMTSQAALASALAAREIEVNQATLSRDLKALGVVKGPGGYRLPDTIAATAPSGLAGAVRAWVVSAVPSQNFVIVRTPMGGASPLAVAIDQAQFGEILGTIAGDDTVFIATPDVRSAKRLLGKLSNLSGGGEG